MRTNLNCYVVDDEWHVISLLTKFINATVDLDLMGASTNPVEAIKDVLVNHAPDVTFLDVNMQQMSGLDFAVLVKKYTNVVFISTLPSIPKNIFSSESFEYLPKPISYAKFLKCIERIRQKLKP